MTTVLMDIFLQELPTPSLILDFEIVSQNYQRFTESFSNGEVYYAMKANANFDIVQMVVSRGGGLEIASLAELDKSLRAGASGDQIICSHPFKTPQFLHRMQDANVYAVVVDSTFEVEKVAEHMPGARVYVRLAVDNTGSVLPLAGKFGVDGDTALMLSDLARERGLQPIGLSFHVGSQCLNPQNWVNAIASCGALWRAAAARGHRFTFLDIGGGYPAGHAHDASIPSIEAIGAAVEGAISAYIPYTPDLKLVLEPGRGLSGEAGRLISTVIGKAQRGDGMWLYLDAGVFNGLMETFEGMPPVVSLLADDAADRPLMTYTIAGPSCDSADVMARSITLPETHVGDRLLYVDVGAYTNEYAVPFNGFPIPELVSLNLDAVMFAEAEDEWAIA